MKAPQEAWEIEAFVDGELDLARQLEIERRLLEDTALRKQVEDARALREMVRANAERHAAPPALRARLETLLEPPQLHSAPQPRAMAPPWAKRFTLALAGTLQRWFAWRPLVASSCLAVALVVAANLAWLQSSQEQKLADEIVASHVRSTLGSHLVDVASSDHHTVKPFLSSRLDFSPPVDGLGLPGSVFVGGRVDYLDGRPVAALVYRQGEHVVNSFVWPGAASDSQPSFSSERGYQIAHWSHAGMTHWVISDVNREEFKAIVQAVRTIDAAR